MTKLYAIRRSRYAGQHFIADTILEGRYLTHKKAQDAMDKLIAAAKSELPNGKRYRYFFKITTI